MFNLTVYLAALSATAGLRLLPLETSSLILSSCYSYLSTATLFQVYREDVSMISGEQEGAFGWLSVNFLHGDGRLAESNFSGDSGDFVRRSHSI